MKKQQLIYPLIVFAAAAVKAYWDTNHFKVNKVQLQTDKIPAGKALSILQISDLHNKVFGSNNEKLVQAVKEADADIVVLTGDLISRDTKDFQQVFSLIEEVTAVYDNVFFVSGNHEWDHRKAEGYFNGLRERGVVILDNRNVQVTVKGITVNLAGVDDAATEHENLEDAFTGIEKGNYTILLSHAPDIVAKYADIPADLILSGHTHGGQVRMPLLGAIIAPGQGFFPKMDKGVFQISDCQSLYIDSGLGTSRLPVRFLNQSQISLIEINQES